LVSVFAIGVRVSAATYVFDFFRSASLRIAAAPIGQSSPRSVIVAQS
jgi:hypothetical protein